MKKTLSLLIALLLCVSAFSGCNNVLPQNADSQTTNTECEHNWERIGNLNESTAQDRCTKCGETRLYTDPDSINKPNDEIAGMKGTKVWDWHHPDDSERNPEWAITFASMPNVEFKRENSSVYANDELLIGGPGYVCMSFYTAELTETNKTLLCFGMSLGSGICDERIVIIDFDTKQELFVIHDRMNYDYQLFVRNGILCVREIKYGTNEITRTGIFYDEGTQIQILWDEHIVLDEDRDQVQNDQPTDSNTECVHTYGEWQYDETYHWCDWSCSLDLCDIDTTGEHIDKDGDSVCDTCNYIILNCVHTYGEWQYNETHHWCDWSCSLNMCRIETTGEHFDEDENGVCDKCGYFPPINSDVMGFNLQKIVFDSLENTKRTPTKDTDVIDGINSTIKMGSNAYDAIEFCFYYSGNVSEELFEDMHYSNIVQANEPTRMIVRVKYNNINIEALKTLSQSSQIISIHISAASDLGVEPEPDVPLDSNDMVDAVILKDGFTFKESWIDSNNELTESKTFVVESQEALNEIFTEFKDVNFDKEMVIVYCYTTIYIREQKLEKVSFDNNVLSIEFDVVDGKPGTGDATAPQTRTCVICLDKVAATEVKVTYNGQ